MIMTNISTIRGCMKATIISLLVAGGVMFSLLSLISLEVILKSALLSIIFKSR